MTVRDISPHPKPTRGVCESYLEHVRTLPCSACGAWPVDPHHMVSVGAGGDDLTTVPLCQNCHHDFHAFGVETFQQRRGVNLWRDALITLTKWLRHKGDINQ